MGPELSRVREGRRSRRGGQTKAVLAIIDAGRYASNQDYPERDRAYRQAVEYVEHIFGQTLAALYQEEFDEPADEEVLRPPLSGPDDS